VVGHTLISLNKKVNVKKNIEKIVLLTFLIQMYATIKFVRSRWIYRIICIVWMHIF